MSFYDGYCVDFFSVSLLTSSSVWRTLYFLFIFMKRQVLPSLGDYLTANGGHVNLKQVDVIMGEVGEIEDEVFKRRKQADVKDEVTLELF